MGIYEITLLVQKNIASITPENISTTPKCSEGMLYTTPANAGCARSHGYQCTVLCWYPFQRQFEIL